MFSSIIGKGEIDSLSIGECAFIVILGLLSIVLKNDRLLKFQPTVVAFLMALVFLSYEVRHKHFLVEYVPHLEKIMVGDKEPVGEIKAFVDNLHTPLYLRILGNMSRLFVLLFLAHGFLMIHAALHCTTARWFAYRMAVYPGLIVVMFVAMAMSGMA
ncbi:MAG: hypothetical protein EOP07_24215 [Proteobacteria bacterium]|nr:MAG: hypothetical protein EOP07_24215 [Pseudomonadota bacterium]